MKFVPLLFLLIILAFQAFGKQKLHEKVLNGKWLSHFVTIGQINNESTIVKSQFPGNTFIDFTNEYQPQNCGGTIYGKYASGRARLPIIYENVPDVFPAFAEGRVLLLSLDKKKKYFNFKNNYNAQILFQPFDGSDDVFVTFTTNMTILEEGKMIIRFQLQGSSRFIKQSKETYFELILTQEC